MNLNLIKLKNKTLIVGASDNPERYAFKAAAMLLNHKHNIVLFGRKKVDVLGHEVDTNWQNWKEIETVTLYIGSQYQAQYYRQILALKPKRVIFNPGTENAAFQELLQKNNILAQEACTLVMLSTGQYNSI